MAGPNGAYVYVIGADNDGHRVNVQGHRPSGGIAVIGKGLSGGRTGGHRRAIPARQRHQGRGPAARRAGARRRRQQPNEYFRNLHSPADRHGAAHGRRSFFSALVGYELLPVAALPNVDFPPSWSPRSCRAPARTIMAETVATPLKNEFTQIPGLSQMTSTSGLGQTTHHAAVRPEPSTSTAPPADVQQAINAASGLLPKNHADAADLSRDQSGRSADPHLRHPFRRDAGVSARHIRQHHAWRSRCRPSPASARCSIAGQQQPAVTVQVNPEALAVARPQPGPGPDAR